MLVGVLQRMDIGMGLPGINEHRILVCEWRCLAIDAEGGIGARCLYQNMAVVVSMSYQCCIHLEQREPAKITMKKADC